MNYYINKETNGTVQLPEKRKHIRALNDYFYKLSEVSYAMYLHQVKLNNQAYELRHFKEQERTPRGFYWHAKYLPPRSSVIGDETLIKEKQERQRFRDRERYYQNNPTARRRTRYVAERTSNQVQLGEVSGGE